MSRITNNDQIAFALQARLENLKKKKKSQLNTPSDSVLRHQPSLTSELREIFEDDESEESILARRVVTHLLEEEFGKVVAEDPRFATVIHRVSDLIIQNELGQTLMNDARFALRRKE